MVVVGVGAGVGEAGADCCHDAPQNREQPDGFRPRTSTKNPPDISWRENFLRGGKRENIRNGQKQKTRKGKFTSLNERLLWKSEAVPW